MKPLIIFDCDGVLVDSEKIASAVFAEHLALAGYAYTSADCLAKFTGLSLATCGMLIEQESGKPLPVDFFSALQHSTFQRFSEELQPIPGVLAVLEFLQLQGWRHCVASSGSHEKMALTLAKAGLKKFFGNRIFSADDVQRGKPAPDLFLAAAQALGYASHNCIVIEDSRPGVMAALAAGMQVCAFGADRQIFADAQPFSSMSELPPILISMREQMLRRRERE